MSNLMTVVPFLSPPKDSRSSASTSSSAVGADQSAASTPVSRPGCWAYPDMLEVGRMPEHNAAESRSHLAAWAMVSAPLALGFDLSDETKMAAAWPIISNEEVLAISQTWIAGAKYPTGRLLKRWRAPNVPTFEMRGGCGSDASWCQDENPKCSTWAKEDQCEVNPGYMLKNCRRSCHSCEVGEWIPWGYSGSGSGAGCGPGSAAARMIFVIPSRK